MADRCLVCGKDAHHSHLGVLICRACKIFYRRSSTRKRVLVCRPRRGRCAQPPRCKKCRYRKIDRLVKGVEAANDDDESASTRSRSPEQATDSDSDETNPAYDDDNIDLKTDLLDRVGVGYRTMCATRRAVERIQLHPSRNLTNAFQEQLNSTPLVPATITSLNFSLRLLASTLTDFATNVFDEFSGLSERQKWYLLKNFFFPFWTFESAYRICTQFPDLRNTQLMSFTTYLDEKSAEEFMDIEPRTPTAKKDARDLFHCFLRVDTKLANTSVNKADLSEEEFHALLVLAFWNIENTSSDEELLALSFRYRSRVLADLEQSCRRRDKKCAARIGDLTDVLVVMQELSFMMPMNLEMFSMLNVFGDDTTMYQMAK